MPLQARASTWMPDRSAKASSDRPDRLPPESQANAREAVRSELRRLRRLKRPKRLLKKMNWTCRISVLMRKKLRLKQEKQRISTSTSIWILVMKRHRQRL